MKFLYLYLSFTFGLLIVANLEAKDKMIASESGSKKIDELSKIWKKNYRIDSQTAAVVKTSLSQIGDAHRMLSYTDIDASFQAQISKFRETAVRRIADFGDKAAPYLIQEYLYNLRDKFAAKDKLSLESKTALDKIFLARGLAIEDSLTAIGVSAIPVLTDLHSKASKVDALSTALNIKALITKIVKGSERDQNVDFAQTPSAQAEKKTDYVKIERKNVPIHLTDDDNTLSIKTEPKNEDPKYQSDTSKKTN